MTVSASALAARAPATAPLTSLLDPDAVSASLERAGLRPDGEAPLRLERAWPMPKSPLMLRYRDPRVTGKKGRWWTLHRLEGDNFPFAYRRALRSGTAVFLEDLSAVVQAFPNDLLLEQLAVAASSRSALATIQASLRLSGRGPIDGLTAKILGYKPARRCTVRYRLDRRGERGTTVFGKCLTPEMFGRLATLHRHAARAAARERWERLRIAEPAGRIEAWSMLWWKRCPGRSLFELLRSPDLHAATALAGHALAELHGSALPWSRTHLPVRELSTLRTWIASTSRAFPGQRRWLESSYQRLAREAAGSSPASLVPSHRDFYDKQILISAETATFLDQETAALAEPELDVANFLTHLELRGLQTPGLDLTAAADSFLASYSRHFRTPDRRRLSWYRASALVRLACVYSFRPRWPELPLRLQRLAQNCGSSSPGHTWGSW